MCGQHFGIGYGHAMDAIRRFALHLPRFTRRQPAEEHGFLQGLTISPEGFVESGAVAVVADVVSHLPGAGRCAHKVKSHQKKIFQDR